MLENSDIQLTLIGAGCINSNLIPFLARIGFSDVTVFDFDLVEEKNRKNQIYRTKDIGTLKVNALHDIILEMTGVKIHPMAEKIDAQVLSGIVICGVDSMKERRKIWQNCIKMQPQISLYIDARVGGSTLKVFALDPTDLDAVDLYEQNLHTDSTNPEITCLVGEIPTLLVVASVVTQLLLAFDGGEEYNAETIIDIKKWMVLTQ